MNRSAIFQYASPRAAELPAEVVQETLDILTEWRKSITHLEMKIIVLDLDGATTSEINVYEKLLQEKRLQLEGAINLLEKMRLYPAWNWYGHRNEYIFPSETDCEIQYDYLLNCAD